MLAIREHLRLEREECPAGIHEVDAGEAVVDRNLLRPEVFLDRDRVVRAAFDGRVVGDDHHLASADAADARDQASRRCLVVVHARGGQHRELEERRVGIEQLRHPLADREFALLAVPLDILRAAALARARGPSL
jgi:hypothetical protein